VEKVLPQLRMLLVSIFTNHKSCLKCPDQSGRSEPAEENYERRLFVVALTQFHKNQHAPQEQK
jgi:hypothetical protein